MYRRKNTLTTFPRTAIPSLSTCAPVLVVTKAINPITRNVSKYNDDKKSALTVHARGGP